MLDYFFGINDLTGVLLRYLNSMLHLTHIVQSFVDIGYKDVSHFSSSCCSEVSPLLLQFLFIFSFIFSPQCYLTWSFMPTNMTLDKVRSWTLLESVFRFTQILQSWFTSSHLRHAGVFLISHQPAVKSQSPHWIILKRSVQFQYETLKLVIICKELIHLLMTPMTNLYQHSRSSAAWSGLQPNSSYFYKGEIVAHICFCIELRRLKTNNQTKSTQNLPR